MHGRKACSRIERLFEGAFPWLSSEASGSSAPLPSRWKNVSVSKATWRVSLEETARASCWARMVKAVPLACFFLQAGEVLLRCWMVSEEQHGSFRKGPREMGVADCGP